MILSLLRKILTEEEGFKIVATAANGREAKQAVARHEIDLMTLDIHMPEQDGLSYLKENFGPKHPPVLILSSVSREDPELAQQCIRAGASDYVEKPTLANLSERGDEIRTKLKSLARPKGPTRLDNSFASAPKKASNGLCICLTDSKEELEKFLSTWKDRKIPLLAL